MLFVSFEFAIFLPTVLILYFIVPVNRRWILLLLASYLFYGFYNPAYIILLLFSTSIDFLAGQKIFKSNNKKGKRRWVILSIVLNLGLLFFFKYFNFFADEAMRIFSWLNVSYEMPKHNLLLPLGISFYTFQTISYTIDIYRGYLKPETHFGKFALYVCFFPQLVAGPIERAKKLLPQLHFNYAFDYTRIVGGCQLILWGLFKKLVVADNLSLYVDQVFDVGNNHHGLPVILGCFFFALQVYYDFSAYCDIAIGIARILGVKLSKNFGHHMYQPTPTAFWKEWHITLTDWFRDYVFFPMSKLIKKRWFLYISLFITFVITGLWHGASWTFVMWGTIHGVYLVLDYTTASARKRFFHFVGLSKYPKVIMTLGFIAFFPSHLIAPLFFRSVSFDAALQLLYNAFDWSIIYLNPGLKWSQLAVIIILAVATDIFNLTLGKRSLIQYLKARSYIFRWCFYILLIYAIFLFKAPESIDFIYFDF